MSRELTDLQDLKTAFVSYCRTLDYEDNYIKVCENKFGKIETALKDYEKQHQIDTDLLGTAYKINIQNQKKLKALEIIKEKSVDVFGLICCIKLNKYTALETYNLKENCHNYFLTKEEFDLLKEVLVGKYLNSCDLPLPNEHEQIDELLFWKAENNPKLGIDYEEYEGKYLGAVQNGPIDENFPVEWVIEKEDKTYFASPKLIGSRMIEMSPEDYEQFIGPRVKVKYIKKIV